MTKRSDQPLQKQHRLDTRAPNGTPTYTERIAVCLTPAQRKVYDTIGGSQALRVALDGFKPPKPPIVKWDHRGYQRSPIFTERIALRVTPQQRKVFDKHGRSELVRRALDDLAVSKKLR